MDTKCVLVGIVGALFVFIFYKYVTKIYDYWRKRGIPCVDGALPFFGNSLSVLALRQSFSDFCQQIYEAHEDRSVVGFFQLGDPNLLVRDPEIVKTILISDFGHFHVNLLTVDPEFDPLAARNPFFLDGDKWKIERSHLSVVFMSNKKLKILFGAVRNVCAKFEKYLEDNVRKSGGSFETETKDLLTNFTGEVVASAGFGAEGDFFDRGTGPNSFRTAVTGAFDPTFANNIRHTVLFSLSWLNKLFGVSLVPKRTGRFLERVVREMIRKRLNEHNIVHNDFLQIMMDTQKARGEKLDEFGITVSAASFFLDGYETSAITLGFFAYQIAANPHVQKKLRREITTILDKYGGEITYEALSEMTYMEQALNESMRLYPALGFLVKRCNERCNIVGSDGIETIVEPGMVMVISVRGLHLDPKYWENPEIYDPERFNGQNNKNRPKTVFLPFGEGPRMCVGMRFAIMQIKAAMVTMLRNYSLEVSSRTKVPLRIKPTPVLTAIDGGIWIKFKPL